MLMLTVLLLPSIIITVLRHTATDASIVIHQHGHSYRNTDPNNMNIVNTANITKILQLLQPGRSKYTA